MEDDGCDVCAGVLVRGLAWKLEGCEVRSGGLVASLGLKILGGPFGETNWKTSVQDTVGSAGSLVGSVLRFSWLPSAGGCSTETS